MAKYEFIHFETVKLFNMEFIGIEIVFHGEKRRANIQHQFVWYLHVCEHLGNLTNVTLTCERKTTTKRLPKKLIT